jgi:thiol-disulfide isomerase/thioredoxin
MMSRLKNWKAWPWRKWLLEAMILIAIVGAVTVWQNRGLPEGMAPPLAGVRTDGSVVKVGAGETAQLVVFWATWCPVCRAEEGNIESVAEDWPVISVAMQSGDREEVAKYLAAKGLKVPAIEDDDGDISIAWRVKGVPAHFILDPAGNIRFRVVGYATTLGLRLRLWWAQQFPLA